METHVHRPLHPSRILTGIFATAFALLNGHGVYAQVPTKCLEIESILVDACISDVDCPGSTEGMNEMVRFITGPAPIAISDLQFQFYSSNFLGIAQNATTALLTSQLDASVQGCGRLLEPPSGIIPAGSQVIFVTSTAMCVQANPFTVLNDTLYVIFQNPGNSQGHFKNNNLVGLPVTTIPDAPLQRWLRINVAGTSCGDTATYDANQLVNIYGTYGGLTSENDGAIAEFSWPGQPGVTYVNHGCQAPFVATEPVILSAPDPIPCGQSTNLIGMVNGSFASVHWQGGGGVFSQPDSMTTLYTPGGGDNGNVVVSFCAIGACNDTICDQITLVTAPTPQVSITGDSSLCLSTDVNPLTAYGADTYLWSTGETTESINVSLPEVGPIWVLGTSACGSDSAFTTLSVMSHTLTYQNISCNGAADGELNVLPEGGTLPYTFLWTGGDTTASITGLGPGTYDVSVSDAQGCTQTNSFTITEPPLLTAVAGGDTTICPGGQATLTAEAFGGTPSYIYMWSPDGPLVSPLETTTYALVVSDANGCTSPPVEVTVEVPNNGSVSITTSAQQGCAPFCVDFAALPAGAVSYAWAFGDGGDGSGEQITHCYDTPGNYPVSVLVDQGIGCPAFALLDPPIMVGSTPVAAFSFSPNAPDTDDPSVQFTDLSSGANTWAWQFGDPANSTSTDASPAFTFPGIGCYPVLLTVSDGAGCTAMDSVRICVTGNDSIVVPNVFTPNGDGNNDDFRVLGMKELDLSIYNRWGQLVATLQRPNQSWDGRTGAGEQAPEGTYFYTLRGMGDLGEEVDMSGTITLRR
ncbi:MAG: PKD domain-containing protein [Flavobacteriales bacterium]